MEKRPKMLCRRLKEVQKIRKEKRAAALEEDKINGVCTSVSKHRTGYEVDKLLRQKKADIKTKRERRKGNILHLGMGARERDGMIEISGRELWKRGLKKNSKEDAKGGKGGGKGGKGGGKGGKGGGRGTGKGGKG